MKCAVHADVEASWYCRNCGKPLCEACSRRVRDAVYCEDCLARGMGVPAVATATAPPATAFAPGVQQPMVPAGYAAPIVAATPKTGGSPVLAFLLGFVPGLGAVYNGEYNKAFLHLIVVAGIIVGITGAFGDDLTGFWIVGLVAFEFYMAIDALRVAKAKNTPGVEAFPDPVANWSENRSLGPYVLIGLGALILLHNFGFFEDWHLKRIFLPLILIGVGFLMIRNRITGNN